jgi:hypothetical protein
MNDISGVSESMQGQRAASGTPARLYAQETQNASLNTKDYFSVFASFIKERDWKALKTIIQFYDEERKIALAGANYTDEAMIYNPDKAKSAEVDVVMAKSPDSPVYRGMIEESLQQFVGAGLIDLKTYLKNSTLPFADNMLSDITQREDAMMKSGAIDPSVMGQVGAGLQNQGADASQANPETVAMLQKFMEGAAA